MDGAAAAISHIAQNEQMKKRSLDCSNERFSVTYSPALPYFDTVYHQCMDSMTVAISHIAQNEQLKKRSLDCSNERFV